MHQFVGCQICIDEPKFVLYGCNQLSIDGGLGGHVIGMLQLDFFTKNYID
ncbi:hypothetical protein Lalb_Chr22g0356861 [Lupinus albus]|uniref:Uncharacterized protein n=1 Tax=Lupinus albus TaxID=3870 RepID=A0A6A4NLY6_LUPAL|nr:hypothetical protein Lalb_Chr22g0356861 [Lupinus albus]